MKEDKFTDQQTEVVKNIGNKIKQLRKQNKISYPELAKKIGMNKNSYYNLESGSNFTIRTLMTVLDYYGMNIKEFFCDIDS